jgi:hypothetical protein
MTERDHQYDDTPDALPPELVATLEGIDYACVTVATTAGTALLLKAPRHEIESARGQTPIRLGHELYAHPAAPVIRMSVHVYDQPASLLALETFINVADPDQRADYAALAEQDEIPLLFLDEHLAQRLTKRLTHSHSGRDVVPRIVALAEQLLDQIPPGQFDFERAKQAVMEAAAL